MANPEHLKKLNEGVNSFNQWREKNPHIQIDLSGAYLSGDIFSGINLSNALLTKCNFYAAHLTGANLSGADLRWTDLRETVLFLANLSGANLIGANLSDVNLGASNLTKANLFKSVLSGAYLVKSDLTGANLSEVQFVDVDISEAILINCRIYGISAWDLSSEQSVQKNLIITPEGENSIAVDSLEIAQFIYLLLNNEKIRDVINTITSKMVLILGRFTVERKKYLNNIRTVLNTRDYYLVPVIFDFDKPEDLTITETITVLAKLSKFIIADITDPNMIIQELTEIVPNSPSTPILPIIESTFYDDKRTYLEYLKKYPWFLFSNLYRYSNVDDFNDEKIKQYILKPALNFGEKNICQKCGIINEVSFKFCGNCGTHLFKI